MSAGWEIRPSPCSSSSDTTVLVYSTKILADSPALKSRTAFSSIVPWLLRVRRESNLRIQRRTHRRSRQTFDLSNYLWQVCRQSTTSPSLVIFDFNCICVLSLNKSANLQQSSRVHMRQIYQTSIFLWASSSIQIQDQRAKSHSVWSSYREG